MKPGSSVTLAGFGVSDYKKDSQTGKFSGEGSGLLRQIDNIGVISLSASGQEMTFDQSKGSGACHGDSGGPAYFLEQATQKSLLVGVTSRGTDPSGLCNGQVIYTSVAGYTSWIDSGLAQWAAQ